MASATRHAASVLVKPLADCPGRTAEEGWRVRLQEPVGGGNQEDVTPPPVDPKLDPGNWRLFTPALSLECRLCLPFSRGSCPKDVASGE